MIINIPIQIDERVFEQQVQDEYDEVITKEIIKIVKDTLKRRSHWKNDVNAGMEEIISDKIDLYLREECKDEIIDLAAKELAKRVQRTKAWKEKWGEFDADASD